VSRPEIAADVLAALMQAVPERVAKKLDAAPRTSDGWTWVSAEAVTVFTGSETVTLQGGGARGPIVRREDVTCTCLLQPRCFHVVAVVSVLPVASGGGADDQDTPAAATTLAIVAEPSDTLTQSQIATAEEALRVGAQLLTHGLSRVSTLRLADLVRVAHGCRKEGLPRLEGAVMGVFDSARALRDESPDFTLEHAEAVLSDLLLVATMLSARRDGSDWVGVARRAYRDVGALKLAGVACAPVVAKGYAGVVTYFTDGDRVFACQEVLPGDEERAVHAYDAQLRFGEVSLSHRDASRAGLVFAMARVSRDDRLGAGKDVTCAATPRDAALVERLFAEPVARQLARVDREERHGLVFVRGTMRPGAIELAETQVALPLIVPIDHPRFAYRENLERLASVRAQVSLVAALPPGALALTPVAVKLEDAKWVNLAYDRLGRAEVPDGDVPGDPAALDLGGDAGRSVLDPVRRRLLRFALMGEQSLPGAALPEVARECARLRASLMPAAADCLEVLATTARTTPQAVAQGWLALRVYCETAERALVRSGWGLE